MVVRRRSASKARTSTKSATRPSQSKEPDLGRTGEIPKGFNPEANSQELPIPVADGEHFSEVTKSELEPSAFKGKDEAKVAANQGVKHWRIPLQFKVIGAKDPDKGKTHFGQVFTTWRETSNGLTNQVVDMIKILGGDYRNAGEPTAAKDILLRLLDKKKHVLKVSTQWQAQYTDETKDANGKRLYTYLKGMGSFPKGEDGKPRPAEVDNEGRSVRTVAEMRRFSAPD